MKISVKLYYFFLGVIICSTLLTSCNNTEKAFLIKNNSVGLITKQTKVDELESIFKNDTVVESAYEGELRYASKERFIIRNENGDNLLEITPKMDNSRTVGTIQILSDKYKTDKGISLASSFGAIKKHYTIDDIQNTWNNVVITVNEINAFFTIDKKYLEDAFKENVNRNVTVADIPDTAPIKYFMISWN